MFQKQTVDKHIKDRMKKEFKNMLGKHNKNDLFDGKSRSKSRDYRVKMDQLQSRSSKKQRSLPQKVIELKNEDLFGYSSPKI